MAGHDAVLIIYCLLVNVNIHLVSRGSNKSTPNLFSVSYTPQNVIGQDEKVVVFVAVRNIGNDLHILLWKLVWHVLVYLIMEVLFCSLLLREKLCWSCLAGYCPCSEKHFWRTRHWQHLWCPTMLCFQVSDDAEFMSVLYLARL